jgi:2-keto-4-pentenoate hydratase
VSDSPLFEGLRRQLEKRAAMLRDGAEPLGWKAGFGAPDWLRRFDTTGPLVGYLTDATVIPDGGIVDISQWTRAVAEPELAVTLGADLVPPIHRETTRAAIAALGPAIELADIDPPPEEVEEILAGNIFHRGVVLGRPDPTRAGADLAGLEARIRSDGREETETSDLEGLTGKVVDVVAHLASLLEAHGETIRAGEVVICGSVVPPIPLTTGARVEFELHPAGVVSVQTAR